MNRCEGQKAECYQPGVCQFCQPVEIVESGMLIEMFGEPNTWGYGILIWLSYLGVAGLLMYVGFLAAKLFN